MCQDHEQQQADRGKYLKDSNSFHRAYRQRILLPPCAYTEIAENDYNLSVSTYVEQEDTREVIDIAVLNAEIAEIVKHEDVLRAEIDKIIAEIEG